MNILRKKFVKNDMNYKLLERKNGWCLFVLTGTYPEAKQKCYEISRVYINKHPKSNTPTENITRNSKFGIDGSSCWNTYSRAKKEFDIKVKKGDGTIIGKSARGVLDNA